MTACIILVVALSTLHSAVRSEMPNVKRESGKGRVKIRCRIYRYAGEEKSVYRLNLIVEVVLVQTAGEMAPSSWQCSPSVSMAFWIAWGKMTSRGLAIRSSPDPRSAKRGYTVTLTL